MEDLEMMEFQALLEFEVTLVTLDPKVQVEVVGD